MLLAVCSIANADVLKTSFYHQGFIGKRTASGEIFHPDKATAASNRHKFGTILKLSYKGESINVCINDTGGFKKYGRDLDVTKSVATKLNFIKDGVVRLESSVIYKPKRKISCPKAWQLVSL
jgi:rare lipoprotein A